MIILKKDFIESIILHSKKEHLFEACGIFAGKNGVVEKVYSMANVEKSPSLFLMDAAEQRGRQHCKKYYFLCSFGGL